MSGVSHVSVIIPFFQRDAGILRRALQSVLAQRLPDGVHVRVIVVDDGSPVGAASEIDGLDFSGAFELTLIEQANGGVGVARNRALAAVSEDTDVLAFLDSDDCWKHDHIAKGLAALQSGYDFYFCDNAREGHHDSHFVADAGLILPYIQRAENRSLIALTTAELSSLILRDFPCQMSTVMFRYGLAKHVRFDTSFQYAGEDVLFFLEAVSRMGRVCFSTDCGVHCGKGINLYFSNMGWGCEGYMKRLLDDLRAHELLANSPLLSVEDKVWNAKYVRGHRQQMVFFSLRYFWKHQCKWPPELAVLSKQSRYFWVWFSGWAVYVLAGRVLGFYKPF